MALAKAGLSLLGEQGVVVLVACHQSIGKLETRARGIQNETQKLAFYSEVSSQSYIHALNAVIVSYALKL